ncbi:hypothetical protein [Neobacillus sp. DY30]|nr:hypothetical protein [Neobacillus sp. DY30]WHX99875.1 hypothetical protein QNH29_25485 [Neobacillus sp. DY30]
MNGAWDQLTGAKTAKIYCLFVEGRAYLYYVQANGAEREVGYVK